jgi:hypothetical protein
MTRLPLVIHERDKESKSIDSPSWHPCIKINIAKIKTLKVEDMNLSFVFFAILNII